MYGFDDQGNPLTDEALIAEIAQFRSAIRKASLRGVGVVSGEGRRIEFTTSNLGDARTELRELLRIARERGLAIGGTAGAIAVEIGA
jgi:hypothetical protein